MSIFSKSAAALHVQHSQAADPVHDSGSWSLQATDAELRLAHTAEHIAAVEAGYDPEAEPPIGDIYYSAGTAAAARTAAGSTIAVSLTGLDDSIDRSRCCCWFQ